MQLLSMMPQTDLTSRVCRELSCLFASPLLCSTMLTGIARHLGMNSSVSGFLAEARSTCTLVC